MLSSCGAALSGQPFASVEEPSEHDADTPFPFMELSRHRGRTRRITSRFSIDTLFARFTSIVHTTMPEKRRKSGQERAEFHHNTVRVM